MKLTKLKILVPLYLSLACLAVVLLLSDIQAPASPIIARTQEQATLPLDKNDKKNLVVHQFENLHTEWVAKSLKAIQAIRPGMTRQQVLKVLTTEGGISTRNFRTYVYRECPYIKVTIKFEPVGALASGEFEGSNDRVISVSQPFLQWSIAD